MSVTNPEAANSVVEAFIDKREQQKEDLKENIAAREQLEQVGTADGGEVMPEADDPREVDEMPGYRMSPDRRIGSVEFDLEVGDDVLETIAFGKPSGRASIGMLSTLEALEENEGSVDDMAGFVWGTLASWSLDEDKGFDYWADEHGLLDSIQAVRQVALGGNAGVL